MTVTIGEGVKCIVSLTQDTAIMDPVIGTGITTATVVSIEPTITGEDRITGDITKPGRTSAVKSAWEWRRQCMPLSLPNASNPKV
jgi:hypothetical protein